MNNSNIFYASSQIEDDTLKRQVCIHLFNSYSKEQYASNPKLPTEYCSFINSKSFCEACGQQLESKQVKLMLESNYFYPESLLNLNINSELISLLASSNSYVKNFENLCIIYENFWSKPIEYLIANEALTKELLSNKALLIGILNKCKTENTEDNKAKVKLFINKISETSSYEILDSKYFDQWKHKLSVTPENNLKYVEMLKRHLLNFDDPSNIDATIRLIPETFTKYIVDDLKYFSTLKFTDYTSWVLLSKLDKSHLSELKSSLTLIDSVNHITSFSPEKEKFILHILNNDEKPRLLSFMMVNDPKLIVDAFTEKDIEINDLQTVKINKQFLNCVLEKEALDLLNVCVFDQNCQISKEFLSAHAEANLNKMFSGPNGEILQCNDVDLIVQYCCRPNRDFDFVRKLVTSLPSDKMTDLAKWKPFLKSFVMPNDKRENKYMYYENNENNGILIEFFAERGLIKNIKYQNNNSVIRCTF